MLVATVAAGFELFLLFLLALRLSLLGGLAFKPNSLRGSA